MYFTPDYTKAIPYINKDQVKVAGPYFNSLAGASSDLGFALLPFQYAELARLLAHMSVHFAAPHTIAGYENQASFFAAVRKELDAVNANPSQPGKSVAIRVLPATIIEVQRAFLQQLSQFYAAEAAICKEWAAIEDDALRAQTIRNAIEEEWGKGRHAENDITNYQNAVAIVRDPASAERMAMLYDAEAELVGISIIGKLSAAQKAAFLVLFKRFPAQKHEFMAAFSSLPEELQERCSQFTPAQIESACVVINGGALNMEVRMLEWWIHSPDCTREIINVARAGNKDRVVEIIQQIPEDMRSSYLLRTGCLTKNSPQLVNIAIGLAMVGQLPAKHQLLFLQDYARRRITNNMFDDESRELYEHWMGPVLGGLEPEQMQAMIALFGGWPISLQNFIEKFRALPDEVQALIRNMTPNQFTIKEIYAHGNLSTHLEMLEFWLYSPDSVFALLAAAKCGDKERALQIFQAIPLHKRVAYLQAGRAGAANIMGEICRSACPGLVAAVLGATPPNDRQGIFSEETLFCHTQLAEDIVAIGAEMQGTEWLTKAVKQFLRSANCNSAKKLDAALLYFTPQQRIALLSEKLDRCHANALSLHRPGAVVKAARNYIPNDQWVNYLTAKSDENYGAPASPVDYLFVDSERNPTPELREMENPARVKAMFKDLSQEERAQVIESIVFADQHSKPGIINPNRYHIMRKHPNTLRALLAETDAQIIKMGLLSDRQGNILHRYEYRSAINLQINPYYLSKLLYRHSDAEIATAKVALNALTPVNQLKLLAQLGGELNMRPLAYAVYGQQKYDYQTPVPGKCYGFDSAWFECIANQQLVLVELGTFGAKKAMIVALNELEERCIAHGLDQQQLINSYRRKLDAAAEIGFPHSVLGEIIDSVKRLACGTNRPGHNPQDAIGAPAHMVLYSNPHPL